MSTLPNENETHPIHIDNDGDAIADLTYQFRFQTEVRNPKTFLYNTGPITSLTSPAWNRRQTYAVSWVKQQTSSVMASGLACPPCNIGPRSTPHYAALAQAAVHDLGGGVTVFAGQRREGFYADLGAVFDLGDLRPFQQLHLIPSAPALGVDSTKATNVHTIALQVPMTALTKNGFNPAGQPTNPLSTIGVWATASRQKVRLVGETQGQDLELGPWVQVCRLGHPLINDMFIPMGAKDLWNTQQPRDDKQFLPYVHKPELAALLPVLYPTVFPHLAAYTAPRVDLAAIVMTGLPAGIIPGFQNLTGPTPADMLRLNMGIRATAKPNLMGLLGGDLAGYPNGRRVMDDVATIVLRAIAGVTIPLVDHTFTPDGAASKVSDNLTPAANRYLATFPYLGVPLDGYGTPSS